MTLHRHACIADPVHLDGITGDLWTVTTPNGGKFYMRCLGYRHYRAWPSVAAMRRDGPDDSVAGSTSPTRTMKILADYTARQGSIVQIHSQEQAMHENTSTQDLAKLILRHGGRAPRELLTRKDVDQQNIEAIEQVQSILEDLASPETAAIYGGDAIDCAMAITDTLAADGREVAA